MARTLRDRGSPRTRTCSSLDAHDHAHRHRRHRPDARHPRGPQEGLVRVPASRSSRTRSRRTASSRPSTCSRTCPTDLDGDADPVAVVLERDGPLRHREGDARRRLRRAAATAARARRRSTPTASSARYEVDPNRGMDGVRDLVQGRTRSSASRRPPRSRPGCTPQVPINDKQFYPLYAKCIELDIPICVCAGVPGPAGADGAARTSSCIDEVCWFFPELQVRDAPRRRAVGRPRGEAHAQVAEPLLLDLARSRPGTTRRRSSTTPTPAAPTRSCTPATSRWACPRAHLHASCPTCRSRTTCGPSSCARTPCGCSSSTTEP